VPAANGHHQHAAHPVQQPVPHRPGQPVKRKLEETQAALALGIAPAAPVGVAPAATAVAVPPQAKRSRVEVVAPAAGAQHQWQHGQSAPLAVPTAAVAVATGVQQAPPQGQPPQGQGPGQQGQRLPTRAEVVTPFLEDFRFFLQHVDEFQPTRQTPAQVDGVRVGVGDGGQGVWA
jgi:hypothetical protein